MNPPLPLWSAFLDQGELAAWLSARGLPGLQRLRYRRVKPGTSAVAGLDLDDGPAFLVSWAQPDPGKIGKYRKRSPQDVLFEDGRVLLARLPADRHLPGLSRHPALVAHADTLSHKPMRRWVGRVTTEAGPVVVRMYTAGVAAGVLERHRAVAAAAPGVARVRRVLDGDVLELDHLPGRPAADVDWPAVGRLLRCWHDTELPATAPAAGRPDWAASAALAAHLLPDRAERLQALLPLAGAGAAQGAGSVLCHGDLSPDQVVVGPDGPALIDLDHAGRGGAAWDLASWWVTAPTAARDGLLAGYGLDGLPGDVRRVLPAVCLGRSTEAFRSCRPDWPAEVDRLLDLAETGAA